MTKRTKRTLVLVAVLALVVGGYLLWDASAARAQSLTSGGLVRADGQTGPTGGASDAAGVTEEAAAA